jgi:hypothetical protein
MDFPDGLHEAANTAPEDIAYKLRSTAGTIACLANDLAKYPNDNTLRELNGLWARGRRLMVTPGSNSPTEKQIA